MLVHAFFLHIMAVSDAFSKEESELFIFNPWCEVFAWCVNVFFAYRGCVWVLCVLCDIVAVYGCCVLCVYAYARHISSIRVD